MPPPVRYGGVVRAVRLESRRLLLPSGGLDDDDRKILAKSRS